jgi:CSLREA domain-containing protein
MLLAGALVADAATFAVNSTVDAGDAAPGDGVCETVSGGGTCTLRAAIEESNAIAGADVVDVPAGVYAVAADPLAVDGDLAIVGAGAGLTIIDGGGGISVGAATVGVSGVTVRDSHGAAGAIYNGPLGTLTLSDSVVSGNGVGGIRTEGTLTIERVIIRGNSGGAGGGIESLGSVVVVDSTIADNIGQFGGGVLALYGTVTLSNTTVSGNTAVYGGGISAGVCFLGCTRADVFLDNATITYNSVSTGDGGGVAVFGGDYDGPSTLTMRNTVIAGNLDEGGEAPDCSPGVISDGYNLIGNATGCFISGDGTGNLIGVSAQLGPLQPNGGPTPTHAPLAGSPLIDAGNPAVPGSGGTACEAADQRGVTRPQGVRCDIGAVEMGGAPVTTTTVTTTSTSTSTTVPPPFCAQTPRGDCMTALSGKSALQLKQGSDDTRDVVSWKWRSSGLVAKADFGAPTVTTDFAICLYETSVAGETLRLEATAPAGGVCAGRSCWKETSSGFGYADRELTPQGLATVRLKAGSPGAGRIAIKGRGANLALPGLPLTAPVIVQLQRRDGAPCWGAMFSAPETDTSAAFRAKAD